MYGLEFIIPLIRAFIRSLSLVCPYHGLSAAQQNPWLLLTLFNRNRLSFVGSSHPKEKDHTFGLRVSQSSRALSPSILSVFRPSEACADLFNALVRAQKTQTMATAKIGIHFKRYMVEPWKWHWLILFAAEPKKERERRKNRADIHISAPAKDVALGETAPTPYDVRRPGVRSYIPSYSIWWYMQVKYCVYNTTAECRLSMAIMCFYKEWRCLCVRSQFLFRLPSKWGDSVAEKQIRIGVQTLVNVPNMGFNGRLKMPQLHISSSFQRQHKVDTLITIIKTESDWKYLFSCLAALMLDASVYLIRI